MLEHFLFPVLEMDLQAVHRLHSQTPLFSVPIDPGLPDSSSVSPPRTLYRASLRVSPEVEVAVDVRGIVNLLYLVGRHAGAAVEMDEEVISVRQPERLAEAEKWAAVSAAAEREQASEVAFRSGRHRPAGYVAAVRRVDMTADRSVVLHRHPRR